MSEKKRRTKRRSSNEGSKSKSARAKEETRASIARAAFNSSNADASKQLHDATSVTAATEEHKSGGDYLKSAIYGGMDGIITTFAVVAAVVGGSLSYRTVLIMGCANLLADGVSMGFGDFVSSTAELEYAKAERAREMWECENYMEGEVKEMVEITAAKKGITEKQARTVVKIMSQDLDTFVDWMMVEELGLMPPDEDDSPAKNGVITFISFCIFGIVPLLAYIVHVIASPEDAHAIASEDATFAIAIALTCLTLFGLGASTHKFTTWPWWKAGAFTFANGAIAALASYFIAWGISSAADIDSNSV